MIKIEIENCVYRIHPVYDLYAADKDGNVLNIIKMVPYKGNKDHNGYMLCNARKHGQNGRRRYQVHRFVWECFNGVVPKDKVIDHINNNKEDNRLCNLQLMTQQQHCKKSAKVRAYTFAAKNHENKRCVKAINQNTEEVSYYNSMYAVQQHLSINAGIVKMVCEGINNCKTGTSKKDGSKYKFEYIKKSELPDNYKKSANKRCKYKKSANKRYRMTEEDKRKHQERPRMSEEDKKKHHQEAVKKWQNKEYKCPKCNKTFKNNYRYSHNKRCK